MSSYGDSMAPEPAPAPASASLTKDPAKPEKKKREGVKMSDKQKADLKKHMDKLKEGGMSGSELKSHRMKMMARMRKGMTLKKAHADIK